MSYFREFKDSDIIVCPACWERPVGAIPEIQAGAHGPLISGLAEEFASFQDADRVIGYTFEPCGHRFERLTFVMQEAPVTWGPDRPEVIHVWFVDDYLTHAQEPVDGSDGVGVSKRA